MQFMIITILNVVTLSVSVAYDSPCVCTQTNNNRSKNEYIVNWLLHYIDLVKFMQNVFSELGSYTASVNASYVIPLIRTKFM